MSKNRKSKNVEKDILKTHCYHYANNVFVTVTFCGKCLGVFLLLEYQQCQPKNHILHPPK
jgi:hypothetical protein